MEKRVKITVRGRVQGVGFRAAAKRFADSLALDGVARNLANGDVEIIAEGEESRLRWLVEWAGHGPSAARVDSVETEYSDSAHTFRGFRTQ